MTAREKSELATERALTAPPFASGRPPTRAEVWARFSYIYDGLKTHAELVDYCKDAWVWYYVRHHKFEAWRKQPDWKEGDPIIEAAVPKHPFFPGTKWAEVVYRHLQIAQQHTAAAPRPEQQQLAGMRA